ncbi:MAG TPA: PilZ domain-containing protein [Thermoanaerobaculia bacterium]|nr:PilZ domain-containing protein [Thermoanaerobaculia bacterium]
MRRRERRQYQRVRLPHPIAGEMGSVRLYVLDLSLSGLRVGHRDAIPAEGSTGFVSFEGITTKIRVDCQVVWTTQHRAPKHRGDRPVFHSGLKILSSADQLRGIRETVAHFVERALDEQKANARGVPAIAALSMQTGQGTDYVKLEWVATHWRRTATKDPKQPLQGFTIPASETEEGIRTLCEAYEASDADGRRLIRAMAELSTSASEGIPTRRYTP